MTIFLTKPPHFLYEHFIKRQREGTAFVIMFFFLLAFCLARLWVYLSIKNIVPDSLTENVRGVHIHHFAYGILITSLIGFLAFTLPSHLFRLWKLKLAGFFGIGLGLTFDEFGMWLRLEDDYYLRHSYDAVLIIMAILINVIYFGNLWKKLGQRVYKDIKFKKPTS